MLKKGQRLIGSLIMSKMAELAYEKEQKQDLNDTYIEWCMSYASSPKKYTPNYESWWNKKYG